MTDSTSTAPRAPAADLCGDASRALGLAVEALFRKQQSDGSWCAELEGDSILISEYLLMKVILGQTHIADVEGVSDDDRRRFSKMLAYLRGLQRDDGTWGQYPGAGADHSATVKAYFILKLFGDDMQAPNMVSARDAIIKAGGAEQINTFSMFYLACLGQVSWDACPAIPPEIALAPRWFPFHLDKVAAWTRTMILPLSLCTALCPVREIPEPLCIDELFVDERSRRRLNRTLDLDEPVSWSNVFLGVDTALKLAQRARLTPLRRAAISRAEKWLLERLMPETTDGLGAIFPPMVYIQVALQALGYAREHPVRQTAERELDRFIIEEEDHIRIQPCFSAVWDTGIALYSLTDAGLTAAVDERIGLACQWLLDHEVKIVGDWVRNLRRRHRGQFATGADEPRQWAAWSFEFRNDWYPDVDDTAMVAMALARSAADAGHGDPVRHASRRAVRWLLAMQNDDGGWAAFDRTKHRGWMEAVPFADHNAMQDPSCADITGRTIEALIRCGVEREHPAICDGVRYLEKTQHDDGSWWGRWGVNSIYGAWQAVGGLHHAGMSADTPMLRKTLRWLRSIQRADGGFGETADSYIDPSLTGKGPSTASQTAWGAMTMMFLAGAHDAGVERAIRWLCAQQLHADAEPVDLMNRPLTEMHAPGDGWLESPDEDRRVVVSHPVAEPAGSWREAWFTGTGFPQVFYLRYHLYRHYFPLMALARFVKRRER